MSDIAPRPWAMMGDAIVVDAPGIIRGRRLVGTDADYSHAVSCVNALHSAGIAPGALDADPECLRKLMEAAVIASNLLAGLHAKLNHRFASRCDCETSLADHRLRSVIRACGIEVRP